MRKECNSYHGGELSNWRKHAGIKKGILMYICNTITENVHSQTKWMLFLFYWGGGSIEGKREPNPMSSLIICSRRFPKPTLVNPESCELKLISLLPRWIHLKMKFCDMHKEKKSHTKHRQKNYPKNKWHHSKQESTNLCFK